MARYKIKRFTDGTIIAVDTIDGSIKYGIANGWVKSPSSSDLLLKLTAPVTETTYEVTTVGATFTLPNNIKGYSIQYYGLGGSYRGVPVEDGKVIEDTNIGGYINNFVGKVPLAPSEIDGTVRVVIIVKA